MARPARTLGRGELPKQSILLHGGLAMCYAALHTHNPRTCAQLYALGALLL